MENDASLQASRKKPPPGKAIVVALLGLHGLFLISIGLIAFFGGFVGVYDVSHGHTTLGALVAGVPPKSPDHSDVNTSRISIQTHQEAQSPTMSEDVWHCTHLPEMSAGALGLPQRFDTGADTLLPTSAS